MQETFVFVLSLTAIFIFAKIFGEVAVRCGQSSVIGELFAGIIIGPSVLGIVNGLPVLTEISELGAIILLFEVGLSTNMKEFFKAGGWAIAVAIVGVILPYFLGYFTFLHFGFSSSQAIFAGAVLTATSVGITARVFSDLNTLETKEAKIVLGAAVIDDVIGLAILAVVSKLAEGSGVSFSTVANVTLTAVVFLVTAVGLGLLITPSIFKFIDKTKQQHLAFIVGISFCFTISALSIKAGLAPIVGAFAAGLVLSNLKQSKEIKNDLKPIYAFFVPVFFVLMGTNVEIGVFNPLIAENRHILLLAGVLFAVAFIGKAAAGFVVFQKGINKLLVGISMVPRGEVGLIFASIGLQNKVFVKEDYSALVAVIMLTTFVTPIILKILLSQKQKI
ncbi:MAG: cation:proton antiporter [Elusimicrobiota bacterium]|jgi:Kef-type K+ transport system membrane component KefB|nr:cation:proton antiporter [Elusimicrobiota bacterium]